MAITLIQQSMNYFKILQLGIIFKCRSKLSICTHLEYLDTSFCTVKNLYNIRYMVYNTQIRTYAFDAASKTEQLQKESLEKNSTKKSIIKEEKSEQKNKAANKKKESLVVPNLLPCRINEIHTVAGISVGTFYLSWLKLSIPELVVVDWNAKALPDDFRSEKDESSILKLAYNIKLSLPEADLYVMETFSMKGRQLYEKINEVNLLSMLTVLLNGLNTDPGWQEKVVFQKKFVLNNLHDIFIGTERVSTRKIVEDIIQNCLSKTKDSTVGNKNTNVYTATEIHSKYISLYKESSVQKREDLSLVFLLTLSFLDVNIFQNETSLLKVQNKKINKLI